MATPLDSCLLKIERAKEHRDALEKYERETFAVESNRPRLGIKFEPDTEDYVLFVNYMPDLNPFLDRYSLILGDAVHNLISALDRLAYQLALLHTGDNIQKPNSVQFPICDTTDKFERAKKRWLSEIAPDHVAIMERFQGYHRVDERHAIGPYFHPLSKLRDLVSLDKHRLPIELHSRWMTDSATHPEEGKMKMLPQVLFWLGIASIPLAWILWYVGPQIELVRPVLSGIDDAALRAVLQEAHAERWGMFVGLWPVTLLVLSQVVEKRVQE